ncbi:MAG: hypothetical protein LBU92_04315 [Prevotellaceae bacterium]|jgi:hypothetical protein|nr:hypothetical protein [Prevotellaceae bacterium]
MKNIFLLFAVMLLIAVSSCSKEDTVGKQNEVTEVEQQPDVLQLLSDYDNMKRYLYEDDGMELLTADLQFSQEQQLQFDNELKVIEQIYVEKPLVKIKSMAKASSEGELDAHSITEAFDELTEVMMTYSAHQGASEQWMLASNELANVVGSLSQKMVESSVVVDLKVLVTSSLLDCQNNVKEKCDLSNEETVMFDKMLANMCAVMTSESFLLDIQNSKINGTEVSNGLTKGLFSWIGNAVKTVISVFIPVAIVFTSAYFGFLVGMLGGPIGATIGAAVGLVASYKLLVSLGALPEQILK